MTTLLIDADPILWKVLTAQGKDAEPITPEQGCLFFDRVVESYETQMKKYFDVTGTMLFLTPDAKTNFRYFLPSEYKYKENRVSAPKPVGFSEVKKYVFEKSNCILETHLEADDLIAIHATEYGDSCCIVSNDKDFRQLGTSWLWTTDTTRPPECSSDFGYLSLNKHTIRIDSKTGKIRNQYKVYGRGLKWFYYQILVGDGVDNIKGAKGVGQIGAYQALHNAMTEKEMWDATCFAYEEQGWERAVENARLLWLRRYPSEPLWEPPV